MAEGADRLERAIERVKVVNWQPSKGAEAIVMGLSSKRRLSNIQNRVKSMFICQDFGGNMVVITAGNARVNKVVWGC